MMRTESRKQLDLGSTPTRLGSQEQQSAKKMDLFEPQAVKSRQIGLPLGPSGALVRAARGPAGMLAGMEAELAISVLNFGAVVTALAIAWYRNRKSLTYTDVAADLERVKQIIPNVKNRAELNRAFGEAQNLVKMVAAVANPDVQRCSKELFDIVRNRQSEILHTEEGTRAQAQQQEQHRRATAASEDAQRQEAAQQANDESYNAWSQKGQDASSAKVDEAVRKNSTLDETIGEKERQRTELDKRTTVTSRVSHNHSRTARSAAVRQSQQHKQQ